MVGMRKHWNWLPREFVEAQGLCSRTNWMGLWGTSSSERSPWPWKRSWTRWSLKVTFNPNHSMILWSLTCFIFTSLLEIVLVEAVAFLKCDGKKKKNDSSVAVEEKTDELWKASLGGHVCFKVSRDRYVQCGGSHSSQHLPVIPSLPTQWINLMRVGEVQHFNKCFHMPLLKHAL